LKIYYGDNLEVMRGFEEERVDLIYIDPPFNTGRRQERARIKAVGDDDGDRVGFGGRRYRTEEVGRSGYGDRFEDYLGWLEPRLREGYRVLKKDGSLFFHVDYREVHYCKVLLDEIFGRECFMNELIWAYDFGARSKTKWSTKHDNILWYVRDPKRYCFHFEEMERIPYMAPGLVGKEKAERGKTPTDVWWHTIVPTNGTERTGYPTQKPVGIIRRIIEVHSDPGDVVLDFFAGSGTTGAAAEQLGRKSVLIDCNIEAMKVMEKRFKDVGPEFVGWNGGEGA